MMILIGELVMGFVFGVGATMLIMFACDRYDDYRQKKEDEEKRAIMMKRIEIAKKRELEEKHREDEVTKALSVEGEK